MQGKTKTRGERQSCELTYAHANTPRRTKEGEDTNRWQVFDLLGEGGWARVGVCVRVGLVGHEVGKVGEVALGLKELPVRKERVVRLVERRARKGQEARERVHGGGHAAVRKEVRERAAAAQRRLREEHHVHGARDGLEVREVARAERDVPAGVEQDVEAVHAQQPAQRVPARRAQSGVHHAALHHNPTRSG